MKTKVPRLRRTEIAKCSKVAQVFPKNLSRASQVSSKQAFKGAKDRQAKVWVRSLFDSKLSSVSDCSSVVVVVLGHQHQQRPFSLPLSLSALPNSQVLIIKSNNWWPQNQVLRFSSVVINLIVFLAASFHVANALRMSLGEFLLEALWCSPSSFTFCGK